MSLSSAISVTGLTKRYGERLALDHATFDVPMGSVCGFVGPNGSGKTTTIRMLLSLITPTDGSGTVLGEKISHPEKYLSRVGAMIEGPAFYPALSGSENLKMLATLGGFPHERVGELLELVGLSDRAKSKYKQYSLGMKQRLGIAAALLPQPELLILDEPTNGLDPAGIHEVRTLLRSLADGGITVFVSSHLLSELEQISDHLVMLREGKMIFSGATEDLLAAQQPTVIARTLSDADLPKLLEIAKTAGHDASIHDGAVHVIANDEWAIEFNKLSFAQGLTLASLSAVRPTLEETFFEMTGDTK
jgi:ABC-2 type transport system ATP-binding protein